MANGKMLDELRNMAEDSGDESTRTLIRMTLSAIAELSEQVKCISDDSKSKMRLEDDLRAISQRKFDEMEDSINEIKEDIAAIKVAVEKGNTNTESLHKDIEEVRGNYLVRLGVFVKANPKTALILCLCILLLFNLWIGSDVSRLMLTYLGVDPGVTDYLRGVPSVTPIPTTTPVPPLGSPLPEGAP